MYIFEKSSNIIYMHPVPQRYISGKTTVSKGIEQKLWIPHFSAGRWEESTLKFEISIPVLQLHK